MFARCREVSSRWFSAEWRAEVTEATTRAVYSFSQRRRLLNGLSNAASVEGRQCGLPLNVVCFLPRTAQAIMLHGPARGEG